MARRAYATLINDAEAELQDSSNAVYSATEIGTVLQDALVELSNYVPLKTREVLTTTASKDLNIAGINGNLLWIEQLEYETAQDPREFRNWDEHYANWISMLVDTTPTAGQTVYLYCAKCHKVPNLTDLVGAVDLVAGYAAGVTTIHIDTLAASETLLADMLFTIASDSAGTVYRLTQDTVLSGNEGDITFQPGLAEAIADGDVVTFENSTLTPQLERLLVALTAARVILSKGGALLSEGNNAIAVLGTINTVIGDMSARITQAVNDIASARTAAGLAPAIILEANTAIDAMSARITQALADIEQGRTQAGLSPIAITEARTKIDDMSARITQAITDIAAGRTEVQKAIALVTTSANGAIAKIDAEVLQALADLDSGRSIINTIPVGANPQTDYAQYAQVGVGNARGYLEEAIGFLRQASADESIGGSYGALAIRELNAAVNSLNQGTGYLRQAGEDNSLANTYGNLAVREFTGASASLSQANGFLSQARANESVAGTYGGIGVRELNAANTALAQAGGYIQKISAGLRIAQTARLYREEGERRLALILRELERHATPRVAEVLTEG